MSAARQIAVGDLWNAERISYLLWYDPCAISAVVFQQTRPRARQIRPGPVKHLGPPALDSTLTPLHQAAMQIDPFGAAPTITGMMRRDRQNGGSVRSRRRVAGTPCDRPPEGDLDCRHLPGPGRVFVSRGVAHQPLDGCRAGVPEPGGGEVTGGLSQRRV